MIETLHIVGLSGSWTGRVSGIKHETALPREQVLLCSAPCPRDIQVPLAGRDSCCSGISTHSSFSSVPAADPDGKYHGKYKHDDPQQLVSHAFHGRPPCRKAKGPANYPSLLWLECRGSRCISGVVWRNSLYSAAIDVATHLLKRQFVPGYPRSPRLFQGVSSRPSTSNACRSYWTSRPSHLAVYLCCATDFELRL